MSIIPKIEIGTTEINMTKSQMDFYVFFKKSIENLTFVDLKGNDYYFDYYIENLISRWENENYSELHLKLKCIKNLYADKLDLYLVDYYLNDCLLLSERYEEFLENTKTNDISTHFYDTKYVLRLNLQKHLNFKADVIDIYCLQPPTKSDLVNTHTELYSEKVVKVFSEYGEKHGSWFELIDKRYSKLTPAMDYFLLDSTLISSEKNRRVPKFKVYDYFTLAFGIDGLQSTLRQLTTKAENLVRLEIGESKKEVSWWMETLLFERIKEEIPFTEIIQHGKPDWIGKQHYDIWIPEWKIAIELHGEQHFKPIAKWGGEKALAKTIERDSRKRKISKENGVDLLEIDENGDRKILIEEIKNLIEKKRNAF